MTEALARLYEFLDRPLFMKSRVLLAVLVLPLLLSFSAPLWRISMEAPQYPRGLELDIYSYQLTSGHGEQDLKEINTLNHYIGMHKITREELADLDWLPFAIGALALLTLRTAAVGNVRTLVDLAVLTGYMCVFSMARFAWKLYTFGHNLAPEAPFRVEPFTPAIFGTKQIANFTTHSFPRLGSIYLGVFAGGIAAVTLWHLIAGRRAAKARARATKAQAPAASAG